MSAQQVQRKLLVPGATIVAILIAAALVWRVGLSPEPADSLRIVYKPNANYLIYFVASEMGYFEEAGIKIEEEEMQSTNLMVQALATDRADFNPSNSVPALYAAEQNIPGTFKMIYVTLMAKGRSNDAITVRADSPYRTLADLKGKKIGGPPGNATIVLLKLILEDKMDPEKDIEIVPVEPRIQLQALESGEVDALFALEPLITFGEQKGISRVLINDAMETYIMDPIPIAGGVVTERLLQERPDLVRRLRRAMERAITFTRENEDEARRMMARAIGMDEETAVRLGVNSYWTLGEVNKPFVQQFADLLLEKGALTKRVDTTHMYVE